MTDILFYGDPHSEFQPLIDTVARKPPGAVVLLGDMEAHKPLDEELAPILDRGIPVHWIPGNHDTDQPVAHDNLFHSGLADINAHGRVLEICGIKIAGLGGVFRGKVWDPDNPKQGVWCYSGDEMVSTLPKHHLWRGGLPLRHRSSIFPSDYANLLGQQADILVTHEAPDTHKHGSRAIGTLAGCLYAKHIIHGHHHFDYDAILSGGIQVRGVGLRGLYRLNADQFKSNHGLS
ncbi:metallophosphoesterase [Magnetovibrio sp. PR-2]|uniref:metallophosphoesterase family protein n=1 Tax=Magnetovibrio sp. PR-2 TaxID=3120356 RepID=UPI002FCDFED5